MTYPWLKDACPPFFQFYGGKWRAVNRGFYPPVNHHIGSIVEPFAGAAGYACNFPWYPVTLYDADPVICGVWDYLIRTKESEILRIPAEIEHVDQVKLCQEAKWLVGFWMNLGNSKVGKSPTTWAKNKGKDTCTRWGWPVKARIAANLHRIRHWKILNLSYRDIDLDEHPFGTWFIDPPYQRAGKYYRFHDIDYGHLAQWVQTLTGNVIVCEQEGADWMPFQELGTIQSANSKYRPGGQSKELVYAMKQWNEIRKPIMVGV